MAAQVPEHASTGDNACLSQLIEEATLDTCEGSVRAPDCKVLCRQYEGARNAEPKLFGNAFLIVSFQIDTLWVCIKSERLSPILQVHGHAFARDLSDQLEMRNVLVVFSAMLDKQRSNRRSRGFETLFYY
ncbi:hypothetical protein ACM43_00995 [Bradyrhizobium sp. CCBAU 45321]|nr:hypothetical protein [Bradyrhizobium sp. CCBAU 45321]